jgi:hypothetical protein
MTYPSWTGGPSELEFELDERELAATGREPDADITLRAGIGGPVQLELSDPEETPADEFGRRLFELSLRQFEAPAELDRELDGVLDDMERRHFAQEFADDDPDREYFLGGLLKKAGSAVSKLASSAVRAGTQGLSGLAGAAMKGGLLKPLAQAAMSFVPGGSMALPLLQSLGFGGSAGAPTTAGMPTMPSPSTLGGMAAGYAGQPQLQSLASQFYPPQSLAQQAQLPWANLASLFQNAFGQLAARTEGEVTDPLEATRLASEAFQAAVHEQLGGTQTKSAATPSTAAGATVRVGRRVVRLRPGEELVIRVQS